MRDFLLIRKNMKKQKGSLIGIAVLVFIIITVLFAVLGIMVNSENYIDEQRDRVGYGDVASYCYGMTDDEIANLEKEMEAVEGTDKVELQEIITVKELWVGGMSPASSMMFTSYNSNAENKYNIYNDDMSAVDENAEELSAGEIYISPSMTSMFDVELGDKLYITLDKDGNSMEFTIKGYFEDPFMGSSMMGMKTILVSNEDYDTLKDLTDTEYIFNGAVFHIFKNTDKSISMIDFSNSLNEDTSVKSFNSYSYTKDAIKGFMMILQNIFSAILYMFILVLTIVAIIVVGHSIGSGIEQDYTDMGIQKAMGFTSKRLRKIQYVQYFITIIAGLIPGTIASVFVIRIINRMLVATTGIVVPESIPVVHCIIAALVFILIMFLIIVMKTVKIGKISPIKAIRGGVSDVYFASRSALPIYQKGMSFWLALRQLVSGKKQYASAILISVLLVFVLSLVGRINDFMGKDGSGIMKSMGSYSYEDSSYNFSVYSDTVSEEEITKIISQYNEIGEIIHTVNGNDVTINGHGCLVNVTDSPELFNILEGRTCLYDNEVVLTKTMTNLLEAGIGDTVKLKCGETEFEFLVSGIYQCSNDMGDNYGMSEDGYKRIGGSKTFRYTNYFLKDNSKDDEIIDKLCEKYGDTIVIDENIWSGIDGLVTATSAITVLMYIIVVVFIMVVCVLTGGKILFREKHDFGVYKSMGFESGKLRLMFALRFMTVALIGAVIGTVIGTLFTDTLSNGIMINFGLYGFVSHLNIIEFVLPGVVVVILFTIFSYFIAHKVKKVSPDILIVE